MKRAIFYSKLSRDFLESAKASEHRHSGGINHLDIPSLPTMFLCAHSIELSLKSVLLANGIGEKAVHKFGHRLLDMQLRAEACLAASRFEDTLASLGDRILALCDDLLGSHTLKYGDRQKKYAEAPTSAPLFMTTEGYHYLSKEVLS